MVNCFIVLFSFLVCTFGLSVRAENVVGSVIVESGPVSIAVNQLTNYVYVSNNLSDSVSVIDGSSNKVIKTIMVNEEPYGIAVNTNTNKIYVVHIGTVSVINGDTNEVESVFSVGGDSVGIAVDQKTNKIYITSEPTNTLSVIDGNTNELNKKIEIKNGTIEIALNPDTNHIYVTGVDSNVLTVIDGSTNDVLKTYNLENNISDVAINPNNNTAYVISAGNVESTFRESLLVDNLVTVIDDEKGEIKTDLQIPGVPTSIEVNPATDRIYVGAVEKLTGANVVYIIDGSTSKVVDYVIVSNLPSALGINGKNSTIYVAELSGQNINGSLSLLDGALKDAKEFGPKSLILNKLNESLNIVDAANIELVSELGFRKNQVSKRIDRAINGMRNATKLKNQKCLRKFVGAFKSYSKALDLLRKKRCKGENLDPTLILDENPGCIPERVTQNFLSKAVIPFFQLTIALVIDDDFNGVPAICE